MASASGSRSSSGPSSDSGGGGASGGEPGAARPAPSDLAAQLWLPGAPQPAAPGRPRSVSAASGAGGRFPSQADSLFNPTERDDINIGLAERVATRSVSDLDYLSVRGSSVCLTSQCLWL